MVAVVLAFFVRLKATEFALVLILLFAGAFAVTFFVLTNRRPRVVAGLLLAQVLLCAGVGLIYFGFTLNLQRVPETYFFGFFGEGLSVYCALAVPLLMLAFADGFDRVAAVRVANRAVVLADDASPDARRRSRFGRELVAIINGEALRPWMALARILPVVLLPTMFLWTLSGLERQIRMMERPVQMPPLSQFAYPQQQPGELLQIHLDEDQVIIQERVFAVGEYQALDANVALLRAVAAIASGVRIELVVAEGVRTQRLIDMLAVLRHAGLEDIVFADGP